MVAALGESPARDRSFAENDFLDPAARRVLDRVRQLEASGEETGAALMRALLADPSALALLWQAFHGDPEELLALRPAVALEGLVRLSWETARECGRMIAGPEHLLIAAVRTSELAPDLERRGLTASRLVCLASPRRPENPSGPPFPVLFAALLLLMQGFCCGCWTLLPLTNSIGSAGSPDPLRVVAALNSVWSTVVPLLLSFSVLGGQPRTWSLACAYLLARSTTLLALVCGGYPEMSTLPVLALLAPLLAFLLLFRSRKWFEVPEREKWRSLWRRGGLALVITWVLDIGILVLFRWTFDA